MVLVDGRTDLSGHQVGRYRVEELLGHGGMGEVYRGFDPTLQRSIVVKRLHPHSPHNAERTQRLQREAQLHGQLTHPHIVRVYDFVATDRGDYIVSELVEGETLRMAVAKRRLSLGAAMRFLVEVASAVAYSHDRGIVHRDLKLDNILVTHDGHAKVTDFGLSHSASATETADVVPPGSSGEAGGTLLYMAPEQLWGRRADPRSDIFSFGIMAYEILAGRHPFEGRSPTETARNILDHSHAPIRALNAEVPVPVSELIDRLLAKSPDARPSTFAEVVTVLDGFSDLYALEKDGSRERRVVAALHLVVHDSSAETVGIASLIDFQRAARAAIQAVDAQLVSGVDREIMACIGYPAAHERSACVAAALAAQLGARVRLAAGLVLGEVDIAPGDSAPILAGSLFARARALAEHAGPGRMLTDGNTRTQLVSGNFSVRADVRAGAYEVDTRAPHPSTEPVGRAALVERICDSLDAAFGGQPAPRTFWIAGEAGIGKTTVVRAVLGHVVERGHRALVVTLGPNDRYVPFSVGKRAFTAALGDDEALRVAFADPEYDPLDTAAAAQIAGVASPEQRQRLARFGEDPLPRQLAARAAAHLVARLGAATTVLLVEDLHWADSGSLLLLQAIADRVAEGRLGLLLTSRPEAAQPWGRGPTRETIHLARLNREDASAVLARVARADSLPAELVDSILDRADGVPLWIEELAQSVVERSERGDADVGRATVPVSLRDAMQYRLQLVGARARRLAELAAALGGTISAALLGAAAGVSVGQLEADLAALESRGLIRAQGLLQRKELTFRHSLMEAAVYADAEPRTSELHATICAALETGVLGAAPTAPALFAHHYQRAGRRDDAIRWWAVAAAQSAEQSAHDLAAAHYERALALVAQMDEGEARRAHEGRLRSSLALSLMVVYGIGSRQVELNNAQLFRRSEAGAPHGSWIAMYVNWATAYVTANLQGITAWTGLIQERADQLEPSEAADRPAYEYLLVTLRALVQYHVGQLPQAIATFAEAERIRSAALPAFSVLPDKSQLVLPGTYAAMCHALLGELPEARDAVHREESAWPEGSAERFTAQTVGALTFAFLREYDEVRRLTTSVIGAPAGLLNPTHTAFSRTMLQLAELDRIGAADCVDAAEATRVIDALWAYLLACSETGLVIGVLAQQTLCAEALLDLATRPTCPSLVRARAVEVARAVLQRGSSDLQRVDVETLNRHIAPEFHRVRARLCHAEGDAAAAASALSQADAVAEQIGRASEREPSLILARCSRERARLSS